MKTDKGVASVNHWLPSLYLLYHELRPIPGKYSYAIETGVFEGHADLVTQLEKNHAREMSAQFTFDDGHASDFKFALPILNSRDLKARFFITVGWTGNKPGYMDWEQVRSIHQAGHSIGAHGWSHSLLTHCSKQDLDRELRGSRSLLEDKLGVAITSMSFPGGRYNRRILAVCREAGYTSVYTSIPMAQRDKSDFIIGRLNICSNTTPSLLERLLQPESKELSGLHRQYRIKAAVRSILGDSLYYKLWSTINGAEPEKEAAPSTPK